MTESKDTAPPIRVLVIHDEVGIGDIIELILRRRGVTVRTVTMKLGGAVAEQDPPDLLILNSEMLSDEEYHRFKAIPALRDVPILFIDAKSHKMADLAINFNA